MMVRTVWLFISRASMTLSTLLGIWLVYLIPFLRWRSGAAIPDSTWSALHRRCAPRFCRLAVRMRGGLIKVGQVMSTRVDLLPVEWTSTLSVLQDRVDPLPFEQLEPHLSRAYGRAPGELFDAIDPTPAGAASFGQVHRALTPSGERVALKIRYPDIEAKLASDLWTMRMLLPLFNFFVPRLRLRPIYDEVRRALQTELDYEQEARFTSIVHANFRDVERIYVPRVLSEYTRRDVICTTWFEGHKITDPAFLMDSRTDRRRVLQLVLEAWVKMMYVDGVFQSDPHPGNLLARLDAQGEPEICIVDFGQAKILTRAFHQELVASVMAFMMRDIDSFSKSLCALGLFDADQLDAMRPVIDAVFARYAQLSESASSQINLDWLRNELARHLESVAKNPKLRAIVIPQELILYGRTFALLSGLARAIDPSVEPLNVAKPLFLKALLSGGPPERPDES